MVAVVLAVAAAATVPVAVAEAMAVVVVAALLSGCPQHARSDDRLAKILLLLSCCGASMAHSQDHRLPQLSIEVWVG